MSKNVVLTDVNDEQILPVTTAENVFVSPSITLKEVLDDLAEKGMVSLGLSHDAIGAQTTVANYTLIEEV